MVGFVVEYNWVEVTLDRDMQCASRDDYPKEGLLKCVQLARLWRAKCEGGMRVGGGREGESEGGFICGG